MVNEWNILLVAVCSGQSPAEADFNLLDTARKVDVYGLHLFAAHVCHSQPCFKLSYLILILQFRKCNILICSSGCFGCDAVIGVSKLSMHINNYMGCDAEGAGNLGQFSHPSMSTSNKLCIVLVVTVTCVRTISHLMPNYPCQLRSKCCSVCYTELIVEDLTHIATIWTLWQRAHSTISFITVAIVHTALITCILPNLSHWVPRGWERMAMVLNYLLLNLNSVNETLLSILYFNMYDCVYTDLVLSGCVVIFKIFHWGLLYDFSVLCTAINMCNWHVYNKLLLTYCIC